MVDDGHVNAAANDSSADAVAVARIVDFFAIVESRNASMGMVLIDRYLSMGMGMVPYHRSRRRRR